MKDILRLCKSLIRKAPSPGSWIRKRAELDCVGFQTGVGTSGSWNQRDEEGCNASLFHGIALECMGDCLGPSLLLQRAAAEASPREVVGAFSSLEKQLREKLSTGFPKVHPKYVCEVVSLLLPSLEGKVIENEEAVSIIRSCGWIAYPKEQTARCLCFIIPLVCGLKGDRLETEKIKSVLWALAWIAAKEGLLEENLRVQLQTVIFELFDVFVGRDSTGSQISFVMWSVGTFAGFRFIKEPDVRFGEKVVMLISRFLKESIPKMEKKEWAQQVNSVIWGLGLFSKEGLLEKGTSQDLSCLRRYMGILVAKFLEAEFVAEHLDTVTLGVRWFARSGLVQGEEEKKDFVKSVLCPLTVVLEKLEEKSKLECALNIGSSLGSFKDVIPNLLGERLILQKVIDCLLPFVSMEEQVMEKAPDVKGCLQHFVSDPTLKSFLGERVGEVETFIERWSSYQGPASRQKRVKRRATL